MRAVNCSIKSDLYDDRVCTIDMVCTERTIFSTKRLTAEQFARFRKIIVPYDSFFRQHSARGSAVRRSSRTALCVHTLNKNPFALSYVEYSSFVFLPRKEMRRIADVDFELVN